LGAALALGTVQFGMAYGVAGRGERVTDQEARAILKRAFDIGIRDLDTAVAYGDIESRLSSLAAGLRFSLTSKVPARQPGLTRAHAAAWVRATMTSSRERLGPGLRNMMFHRADDLLEPAADDLWAPAASWAREAGIRLGVSCYDPETLRRVGERYPVRVAQVPANALDQRLKGGVAGGADGLEIHVRSAFLQGLLLMPPEEAGRRVPAAVRALGRWHDWCVQAGLPPVEAALGIVKGFPGVDRCVVGVDSVAQLDEIAAAWERAPVLTADCLAEVDPDVVDPRRWQAMRP
jgi:aryl-alcohol dehydrogenase-like predicted oxidoreductase